jgi:glycosyltransferase involved in cell wall biosynthesis
MSNPLVSVIIPTYNRDTYLLEAITSVVGQTYTNIEILVIDDGSSVNYAEAICKGFKECKYFYKTNGGLSSARNYGISRANGTYIAFLDDDDFWKKSKIEKQVSVMESKPTIDLVHSSALVVDENGKETGKTIGASQEKAFKRSGNVFWDALGVWVVKSPTPLIRKTVFTPDMLFDESIKVGEDLDFYQRLFFKHEVFYINEPLAFYRDFESNDRLSQKKQEYIGIEQKMMNNFKLMGVTNPIICYRIAQKLVLQAIRNWNTAFPNAKKEKNILKYYLSPTKYVRTAFEKNQAGIN